MGVELVGNVGVRRGRERRSYLGSCWRAGVGRAGSTERERNG